MSTFINAIPIVDNNAIVIPDGPQITYKKLGSIVGHLQTMMSNPTSPLYKTAPVQSAIAISLPNTLEFVASFLSITTLGRIAAPLNPSYKLSELNFYFEDLAAKLCIVTRGTVAKGLNADLIRACQENKVKIVEVWFSSRDRVEYEIFDESSLVSIYSSVPLPSFINYSSLIPGHVTLDSVALIIHTSGTTGKPKLVPLTHGNITQSMTNISQNFDLSSRDKTYLVMPLFHVHGLIGALLSTLHSGGTLIVPPKFSASVFWRQFVDNGATWYSAVPTIHLILLNTAMPSPKPKIRFIRSCSSALLPDTFKKLEALFKAPVIESYGSSETSHCMTSNLLPPGDRVPGTVGCGLNVKVGIVDDNGKFLPIGATGEVVIKGANVMKGYINNPKLNAESFVDGYFRTGDQGFLNEKGFLTLTGRIKELINRGGEKISPLELDATMLELPEVDELVSYGVDDAKYGQLVNAAVVLKKSGKQISEQDIKDYLKTRLSDYKIPVKIHLVDKLPKTATGKIQRRIIAQVFTKSLSKL